MSVLEVYVFSACLAMEETADSFATVFCNENISMKIIIKSSLKIEDKKEIEKLIKEFHYNLEWLGLFM